MADDEIEKRKRVGSNTSSCDPKLMNARVFMGNFPADIMSRQEVEQLFKEFGKILGISLHKTYGFVQYAREEDAKTAVEAWNGKKLKGQILDVNIATERRRDVFDVRRERDRERERRGRDFERRPLGRRESFDEWERRHERLRWGRRSPSPGRLEHEMRMRHMEIERMRMGPRFRGPPMEPLFDDFPMRDPYLHPRDDPFDRIREPLPPPMRDIPPIRDVPPRPPPREPPVRPRDPPPEWEEFGRPRDREERRAPPPLQTASLSAYRPEESGKPLDMQIIVVNRQQKDYAEHVRGKFVRLGLHVDILQLSPTMSLADSLDAAAEAGLLFVVIISNQNEMHASVTLTILHGRNPQEHKNMPLDDALGLVDRDFERYCLDVREGHIPARTPRQSKPDMSSLLSKVASGEQLRPEQLDVIINTLQRQKESSANEVRAPAPSVGMLRRPEVSSITKETIESQQADLQAKILSLLGSSAVVPTATAPQGRPPQRRMGGEHSRASLEYNLPSRPGGDRFGAYGRPAPGW